MKNILKLFAFLLIGALVFFVFLLRKHPETSKKIPEKKIETLGYLTWVPAAKTINKKGVTRYIPGESFRGLNLYNSRDQSSANLMDMNGHTVHRWQSPLKGKYSWHHVEVCSNGDLMVIIRDQALMRLDWNSRLKWIRWMRFHHDISIAENGNLYAITSKEKFVLRNGLPFPVIVDYIVILTASGKTRGEIPVYPLVAEMIPRRNFYYIYQWLSDPDVQRRCKFRRGRIKHYLLTGKPPDILHTNTVEVITRDVAGLCKKNDLLISMRELDMIAIIGMNSERICWHWGPGILQKQHHPQLLENGNILVFDNGEPERKYSRILEIDPISNKVVWNYQAEPLRDFFSLSRGGNQRLPNGNTLITESDSGRVFEVTKIGKIVWEFYNPRIQRKTKRRAAIYRLTRLWDIDRYPFLKNFSEQ